MRGDHLKRHMKKHEGKSRSEDNVVTNGEGTTLGNGTSGKDEELENGVIAQMKELERKIEMGRIVKSIVEKHGVNENSLSSINKVKQS